MMITIPAPLTLVMEVQEYVPILQLTTAVVMDIVRLENRLAALMTADRSLFLHLIIILIIMTLLASFLI